MSKQFIPPIELGQFAPSAAAISSWLYQLWKYLQDNPIPDTDDVERVTAQTAQDYIEENVPPEVQRLFAEAVANLDYNEIVGPDSTIPIYRAANDEISQADLADAYAEGCRFAVVDDAQVYAMLRNGETIVLLPINPVTSVNGETGAVSLFIPEKTSDITNDSGFVTALTAPVRSVNGETGVVSLFIPSKTSELQNDAGFVTAAQVGGVVSVNGLSGIVVIPIPEKTSDLTNDSGFITAANIPVTSVNGQTGAVVLVIPTKTSDLTNDSGFLTSAPVTSVNGRTGAVLVGESNTVNLAVAGWNTTTKQMTVIAIGVTAGNNVVVTPDPASFDTWTSCGVRCIAQANGQLTFYCDTIPDSALTAQYMYL